MAAIECIAGVPYIPLGERIFPIKKGGLPRPPHARRRHPCGDDLIVMHWLKNPCRDEYKIAAGLGDQKKTSGESTPQRSCPPSHDVS